MASARSKGSGVGHGPDSSDGETGSLMDVLTDLLAVREDIAADLRAEIGGMSLDNFLVRPRRRFVERYATTDAWTRLDRDAETQLIEQVACLPSAVADDDLKPNSSTFSFIGPSWPSSGLMRPSPASRLGSQRSRPY
jgi:type I restriction enzyme, R subunit